MREQQEKLAVKTWDSWLVLVSLHSYFTGLKCWFKASFRVDRILRSTTKNTEFWKKFCCFCWKDARAEMSVHMVNCRGITIFTIRNAFTSIYLINYNSVMMIDDCCCSGTLDGGLGLLLPMTEKTYRRLHMLQTKLVECIPHVAGLNPKAFRSVDILILLFSVIYLGIQQV